MKTRELMILETTFPSAELAHKVGRDLVDAGLAVCAQVDAEISAIYRWQGEVKCDTEARLTLKILSTRFELCRGELQLQHPYEVPQVISWSASYLDEAYLAWAKGEGK